MSCDYANGLSPYENKGVLGIAEIFDSEEEVEKKCLLLAELIISSKHVVVHTGAGISTSAGIPDFRSPKGVWTLEQIGKKPNANLSFEEAIPTKTHMALRALIENNYIHYIISQNIDGLHLRSGLQRKHLAELHGNMFIDQCQKCRNKFIRSSVTETVGQKPCGGECRINQMNCDSKKRCYCRGGILTDTILDWEHDLPEHDLKMAQMHSTLADLNITLGTTLQILPSGNLPLNNRKYNGKLVICNLQPTKHDTKSHLKISTYVDNIFDKICTHLGIQIPEYCALLDPTKSLMLSLWTLSAQEVNSFRTIYNEKIKKKSAMSRKRSGFKGKKNNE